MDNPDLYSAIAALTAACNANPVIVLKYPEDFTFTGFGISTKADNSSKRTGQANLWALACQNAVSDLLETKTGASRGNGR